MRKTYFTLPLALTALVVAVSAPLAQQTAKPLVIRDVRIFDGSRVIPQGTIVVQHGKITAVGDNIAIPTQARVLDGSGYTVLPGLIDAHTHSNADDLKQSLVFGVTTVLDMFSDYRKVVKIKRQQAAGQANDMAEMFSAGICATSPKGHGTQYSLLIPTIKAPDEAEAFVDARIAEGSDYIKIIYLGAASEIPTINKATMAALVKAAHKRGKLAIAHIGPLESARDAIEVGVDGLAHTFMDKPPDSAFVRLMAEHGTFIVPTLSVRWRHCEVPGGAKFGQDPNIAPYLSLRSIRNLGRSAGSRPERNCNVPPETLPLLKAAGIAILAGTDAGNSPAHGANFHNELELLVRAGMTPTEALAAATSVPAAKFRLADRGRIAPGLRADLLLVKGDPTTDIKATRNIERIWKFGMPVNRQAYAAFIAQEKEESERLRQSPAPVGSEAGLISDFEAGKSAVQFGKGWAIWDDKAGGGASTAAFKVIAGGAQQSQGGLQISGEVVAKASAPIAGAIFYPGSVRMQPVNLSSKKGISFWAKGDGKTYRILLFSKSGGVSPPASLTFVAKAEWQQMTYTFSQFSGLDGHDLTGIAFVAGPEPGGFNFQIDELRLR